MANTQTCTHIHVTGIRCGSPTLRGESFCYFHQHAHRGVARPRQSRLHPVALIENQDAIQASLMEIINALLRNTIDVKRAELILRALHIAVKNTVRHTPPISKKEMIREIPPYPEADGGADAPARPAVSGRGSDTEAVAKGGEFERKEFERREEHVGTAAPSCPGGEAAEDTEPEPELDIPYTASIPPEPNRESIARDKIAARAQAERDRQAHIRARLARAAETIATDWKRPQNAPPNLGTTVASGGVDVAKPSSQDRKPPTSVKDAAMPAAKRRKNAAHRASGG